MAPRKISTPRADAKSKAKGKKPTAISTISRSKTLRASTQAKTQDTLERRPSHVNYIPEPTPTTADSDKLPHMHRYHPPTDPTYRPGKSPIISSMPDMPVRGKPSPKKSASPRKTDSKKAGRARGRPSQGSKSTALATKASKPQGIMKAVKPTAGRHVLAKPMRQEATSERSPRHQSERLIRVQAEKWSQEQVQTHQKTADWTQQEHHSPGQQLTRFEPGLANTDDDDDMESIHNAPSIDMSDEDEPVVKARQPSRSKKTVSFQQPAQVLFRMAPTRTETGTDRIRLTAFDDEQMEYVGPPTDLSPGMQNLVVDDGTKAKKPPKGKGLFDMPRTERPSTIPMPPFTTTEAPVHTLEEGTQFRYRPPPPLPSPKILLNALRDSPHSLELYEIQPLFDHIRNSIISFAEQHFSFSLTDSQTKSWPLHLLSTTYLPLLLTTQYIADGSQYGWRRFFTSSQTRPYLVAAIIGEYLKHHVFNATAFGFPDSKIEELEDDDRRYLHYDAFVRTKKRGEGMRRWFEAVDGDGKQAAIVRKLNSCAGVLADELLGVMEPLLPVEVFNADDGGEWRRTKSTAADERRKKVTRELKELVVKAGLLHWGIRLKGGDGTIVRIAPSVQKGEKRYLDAPFEDVNPEMLKETEHHMGGEEGDKPRIRMTVFSRVEAVVPNGPTYTDLVDIQDNAKEDGQQEVDWEKVRKEQFVWPVAPDDVKATEERKRRKLREDEEMTAAYVTVYPILNKHKVYVEWESEAEKEYWSFQKDDGHEDEAKKDDEREVRLWGDGHTDRTEKRRRKIMNEKYGVPVKKADRMTLRQAVTEARAEKKLWLEDGWNTIHHHFVKWEPAYENIPLLVYLAGAGVSRFWFGHDWRQVISWPSTSILAVGHAIKAAPSTIKAGYQYCLIDQAISHDLGRARKSAQAMPNRLRRGLGGYVASAMSRINGRGGVRKIRAR